MDGESHILFGVHLGGLSVLTLSLGRRAVDRTMNPENEKLPYVRTHLRAGVDCLRLTRDEKSGTSQLRILDPRMWDL